ncbi:MAG TPA: helix-turn-helix domain-containing protein [Pirellulaceae bacterium]|nr:helix-turn-helix domain-containing protein [Pirellulaceae bacterium]
MARARSGTAEIAWLLANSQQPVYLLNSRRSVLYVNPACAAWLRTDAEQLLGARCDYHSGAEQNALQTLATGLCPPPEAFLAAHSSGVVTALQADGSLERRPAQFLALTTPEDTAPSLLVIVGETAVIEALTTPREAASEPSSTELHVLLRWLRQTLSNRPVLDRWVGESPQLRRVRDQFQTATQSAARVVIVGPTGAGREELARGMHYLPAPASYGPLIPIDCPLVDAESLQAAIRSLVRHQASLSPQHTAALLLCNVDGLSSAAQSELAGFLQLPGFAVRTLATTQTSLLDLAQRGAFHQDLAYALSTLVIELPTLAQRRAELPLIAQQLIEEQNAAGGKQLSGIEPAALDRLAAYAWPGDLEQLVETLQVAFTAAAGPRITVEDLPSWLRMAEEAAAFPRRADERIVLDDFLADVERELLTRALRRTRGNKARAAKLLGISRPRLLRRIEQLGIAAPTPTPRDPKESS